MPLYTKNLYRFEEFLLLAKKNNNPNLHTYANCWHMPVAGQTLISIMRLWCSENSCDESDSVVLPLTWSGVVRHGTQLAAVSHHPLTAVVTALEVRPALGFLRLVAPPRQLDVYRRPRPPMGGVVLYPPTHFAVAEARLRPQNTHAHVRLAKRYGGKWYGRSVEAQWSHLPILACGSRKHRHKKPGNWESR